MVCCTAGARCSTRCRTLSATTRFSPCWCATRAEDALVTEVFINLNFKFRRSNHSGGTQKAIVGDGAARKVFRKENRQDLRAGTDTTTFAGPPEIERMKKNTRKTSTWLFGYFRIYRTKRNRSSLTAVLHRVSDSAARREHAGPKCRRTCSDAVACPVLGDSSFSVSQRPTVGFVPATSAAPPNFPMMFRIRVPAFRMLWHSGKTVHNPVHHSSAHSVLLHRL